MVLVAHDYHAPVEALRTQRRCCSRARKPATEQDERGLGQTVCLVIMAQLVVDE
jgi:hypothetical protein